MQLARLGKGSEKLANIPKINGAVVKIYVKSSHSDLSSFISGLSVKMCSVEDSIQAFIIGT